MIARKREPDDPRRCSKKRGGPKAAPPESGRPRPGLESELAHHLNDAGVGGGYTALVMVPNALLLRSETGLAKFGWLRMLYLMPRRSTRNHRFLPKSIIIKKY